MKKKAIQIGEKRKFKRNYESLTEILEFLVENYPNKGSTYIAVNGEEEFISYKALRDKALQYLDGLQKKGLKPGDKVIVEITNPRDYHLIFWACIYGGIVIIPMSEPISWEKDSESILAIRRLWHKLDKSLFITETDHEKYYTTLQQSAQFKDLKYLTLKEIESLSYGQTYQSNENDMVYIQFSSGTTGDPKGTILTYGQLLKWAMGLSSTLDIDEDGVVISWLPHTHNFGLFVPFLVAMMLGNNLNYMMPSTFIRNPYLFLRKIEEHKVTWFCINNFGLDWINKQVPSNLAEQINMQSLEHIFMAAEHISNVIVQEFIAKHKACQIDKLTIQQAYGLSEATSAIAMMPKQLGIVEQIISRQELIENRRAVEIMQPNQTDGMSFISTGNVIGGMNLRIVDEEGNTVEEDMIGEVQLQGDYLYKGYYGDQNEMPSNIIDGWLCTGDLGYIHNGLLYIVGRKKDIIIIRGINYVIADLEEVIYRRIDIPRGMLALTSIINQLGQDEPIVFIEYKGEIKEFLKLRSEIINCLNNEVGLNLEKVIMVDTLLRTDTGKIKRYLMRLKYEDKVYEEIESQILKLVEEHTNKLVKQPESDIEAYLRKCWSQVLQCEEDKISTEATFAELGGQSVEAYQILGLVSEQFNMELGHEMIATCKTIEEMAVYLEKKLNVKRNVSIESNKVEKDFKHNVAITGMAFRFPKAKNQRELWNNLCNQKDCISRVSSRRRKLANDSEWNDWIGELEDIDKFDYEFFELSKEEAKVMDPQQRIGMMTAYEALEDAGVITDDEDERRIGVYSGMTCNIYLPLICEYIGKHGAEAVNAKGLVGNLNNITAGYISHQYNFTGPVMAIDTACSSFMTALHTATTAINNGEITGAVVMGSNIMSTSYLYALARQGGIISSTNQSKVFDENADGSILGEGVVVYFIEPLEHAIANNKNIYGVICGSAINNDGFALSVMSPNPKGQYSVLEEAYEKAGISPSDISYIEAHGTGTRIGDPIEINALSRIYKKYKHDKNKKVAIGSIKTNIGHLLAAAGGAGLAKVLLCLKHKMLVPSLHMEHINPLLQLDKTPFEVCTQVRSWDVPDNKERIAGITSLGLGGTNVHIIVREWKDEKKEYKDNNTHVLTISAKTEEALEKKIAMMQAFYQQVEDINNLCFTSNRYRRHYKYRAACLINENNKMMIKMSTGKSMKSTPCKVGIYIGDINRQGTEEEFEAWYNLLKYMKQNILNILYITGEKKGKVLADSIEGNISFEQAKHMYIQDQSLLENGDIVNASKVIPDIILAINVARLPHIDTRKKVLYIEKCIENLDENQRLEIIKDMYLNGSGINWDNLYPDHSGKLITLPSYPFKEDSVWINEEE